LENRGLIYRKHGKGTFAHGRSTRIHRYLGILMRSPVATEQRPMAELLRGAQTVMTSLHSAILLISNPPAIWRPEKASSLGGVIVTPEDVTPADIEVLRNRHLPYLIFTETDLPGPRIDLGQRRATRHMTEELLRLGHKHIAFLSGYDRTLDAIKRQGFHEAIKNANLDPAHTPEIITTGDVAGIVQATHRLMAMQPRPTAVLATDDSLALILCHQARKKGLRVPEDLSIVSFHDCSYLSYVDVPLTNVHFEFFAAGQKAAEALSHVALTGEQPTTITFEPTYIPGQTIGPAPK